jgi:hypothetical protein
VEYATENGVQWWLHVAFGWLFLPLMLAGFAVGAFYLWPALENLTAQNARIHAENAGAILYDFNFGFSLVIAIFAWIFAVGAVVGLAPALWLRLQKNVFVFSVLDGKRSPIAEWGVRRSLERLQKEADPAHSVRQMVTGWVPTMMVVAMGIAAASAVLVMRDVQAHSIFTPTEYIRSPFFPWGSTRPREWSTAISVEVGCNHVERRGAISNSIIYQVKFADGASVRIGDAIPLRDSWLDAAETIDQHLTVGGATFSHWDWMGRDPQHPLCIAALRDRYSGDQFGRVRRLLRLPE